MELLLQLVANGLVLGSLYALFALSFNLILSTTRVFHLAHGGAYLFAAFGMYWSTAELGWPLWAGFLLGTVLACLVGVGCELLVYRYMRRRFGTSLTITIASLGILIILENLVRTKFGSQAVFVAPPAAKKGIAIASAFIPELGLWTIAVSVLLFVAVWLFRSYTRVGRAISAVADNPLVAETVGIDTEGVVLFTIALGSALAAPATLLFILDKGATSGMALDIVLVTTVSVIVGGIGSLPGSLMGGLLLGVAESAGVWGLDSKWQQSVSFAVLLFFIILRPKGFMGKKIWSAELQ